MLSMQKDKSDLADSIENSPVILWKQWPSQSTRNGLIKKVVRSGSYINISEKFNVSLALSLCAQVRNDLFAF